MKSIDPALVRGLGAIGPYLDQVVLAGGWVPHVYECLYTTPIANRSLHTRDIDLAVARRVPVGEKSIDQLLREANFECRYHSLGIPPVTKYVATDDSGEIEIEFITNAPGARGAVVHVQPDLTAQELHYVELLLDNPWDVELPVSAEGANRPMLRIPTPGAFLLHKALVHKERSDRLKREKDLYYIFFVLDAFPEWLPTIAAQLDLLASQKRAWFKKCVGEMSSLFTDPDAPGLDALVGQRPRTAFAEMDNDRFRQHGFEVMAAFVAMLLAAQGKADEASALRSTSELRGSLTGIDTAIPREDD